MKQTLAIEETADGKEGMLTLSGDLTVIHASEIKAVIQEATQQTAILHVELIDVESVDISFVQLLCATHRELNEAKKKISLTGSLPEVISNILERTGYDKRLDCPQGADATCLWRARVA